MSQLIAYNLTLAPVVLAAGNAPVTLPASAVAGARGEGYDVTGELEALSGPDYALLQAQVLAGDFVIEWDDSPSYSTPGLRVIYDASSATANTTEIIYSPGNPDGDHKNIRITWEGAHAAVTVLQEPGPKFLRLDARFGDCRVPAGIWDMTNIVVGDALGNTNGRLYISDGAFLPEAANWDFAYDIWSIFNESISGPVVTFANPGMVIAWGRSSGSALHIIQAAGAATSPFFQVDSFALFKTGAFSVLGRFFSNPGGTQTSASPVLWVSAGAQAQLFTEGGGLGKNSLGGDLGSVFVVKLNTNPMSGAYGIEDQPLFLGAYGGGGSQVVLEAPKLASSPVPHGFIGNQGYWGMSADCLTGTAPVTLDAPSGRRRGGDMLEIKDREGNAHVNNITYSLFKAEMDGSLVYTKNTGGDSTILGELPTGLNPGDTLDILGTASNDISVVVRSLIDTGTPATSGVNIVGDPLTDEAAVASIATYQELLNGESSLTIDWAYGVVGIRCDSDGRNSTIVYTSSGANLPSRHLVWRPEATGADALGEGVYTEWVDMYAALKKTRSLGQVTLEFDGRFSTTPHLNGPENGLMIPAGTEFNGADQNPYDLVWAWDMRNVVWISHEPMLGDNPGGSYINLFFEDYAYIDNLAICSFRFADMYHNGTLHTPIRGSVGFFGSHHNVYNTEPTAMPMFEPAAGRGDWQGFAIALKKEVNLGGGGGSSDVGQGRVSPAPLVDFKNSFGVVVFTGGSIQNDVFKGDADKFVLVFLGVKGGAGSHNWLQSGLTGWGFNIGSNKGGRLRTTPGDRFQPVPYTAAQDGLSLMYNEIVPVDTSVASGGDFALQFPTANRVKGEVITLANIGTEGELTCTLFAGDTSIESPYVPAGQSKTWTNDNGTWRLSAGIDHGRNMTKDQTKGLLLVAGADANGDVTYTAVTNGPGSTAITVEHIVTGAALPPRVDAVVTGAVFGAVAGEMTFIDDDGGAVNSLIEGADFTGILAGESITISATVSNNGVQTAFSDGDGTSLVVTGLVLTNEEPLPLTTPADVGVAVNAITFTSETDAAGVGITTGGEVPALIAGDVDAAALVTAALAPRVDTVVTGTVVVSGEMTFANDDGGGVNSVITGADFTGILAGENVTITDSILNNGVYATLTAGDGTSLTLDGLVLTDEGTGLSLLAAAAATALSAGNVGILIAQRTAEYGEIVLVDSSALAFVLDFPSAARLRGEPITVVDVGGGANAVTCTPPGGETVDNATVSATERKTYAPDGLATWRQIS